MEEEEILKDQKSKVGPLKVYDLEIGWADQSWKSYQTYNLDSSQVSP